MNIYIKKSRWSYIQRSFTKTDQNILLKKTIIRFIVLLSIITFLNIFELDIRNSFYFISSPASEYFLQTGDRFSSIFESFLNSKNLKDENNYFKKENQKLLSEINLIQKSFKEDSDLQKIINDNKVDDFKIVLGKTVGLDTFQDFILLDKGEDDGILENMPVISDKKVLYGKISKVYKNFSQVMLISNKNSTLNVKVNPQESINFKQSDVLLKAPIYGVIKGRGGLSIYLDLVNSDAVIKENDILVTSGLEETFPMDLLIGNIKLINQNDLKPFQTAEVKSFFSISDIKNLFIITNYLQK